MTIKDQIDSDLKSAMLAGDKVKVTTLRGLKSAILYEEVASGVRHDGGLSDKATLQVLVKEAKKRNESIELYEKGGNLEQAKAEHIEKTVIEKYLPEQLSDEALLQRIDEVITAHGPFDNKTLGQAIAKVKEAVEGQADGARIAAMVRQRIS